MRDSEDEGCPQERLRIPRGPVRTGASDDSSILASTVMWLAFSRASNANVNRGEYRLRRNSDASALGAMP